MTNWVRARQPDQVSQRQNDIIVAAEALFKAEGYENVSLNRIAEEACFTKSNIYRYFSSKEEIFLNIYSELVVAWSAELVQNYAALPENTSVKRFSEHWVRTILKHPMLLDLSPVLIISLEKNSSKKQLEAFKETIKDLFDEHYKQINRIYPSLTWDDVRSFLVFSHGIVASLWPTSNPDTTLAKVYRKKKFRDMKPDFQKDTAKAIVTLIQGLKSERGSSDSK